MMIDKLLSIKNNEKELFVIQTSFDITKSFELNLFFKEDYDKDQYIKEYVLHKKFLPYYPHSLNILSWEIVEEEYSCNRLFVSFELGLDDYVGLLYQRIVLDLF